ncbi:MAG TPA: pantoate--beta-alanine ligase [Lacipirellulaceae bacterium]|nr:pantoate--beta-alanine ligase [Lacipirellulaceae bacterium]
MQPRTSNETASQRTDAAAGVVAAPEVIADSESLRQFVWNARRRGDTVGLVPTMGALHEGHLSLVDAARAECDVTIATIFVNPAQFAPGEDFREYPRDLPHDLSMLAQRGCDIVFAPDDATMYRPNHATFIDVGPIGAVLEGEFRPTHFRGVATVVMKLFQMAPADRAYFGLKDYQQTLVVRQMVADLNVPIDVRVCPTVRQPDGLAMSSRNRYLSPDERRRALALPRSLRLAEELVAGGEHDVSFLRQRMIHEISNDRGVNLQYIAFVADGTVTPVERIEGPTTIAAAVRVGKTRLIDNVLVSK